MVALNRQTGEIEKSAALGSLCRHFDDAAAHAARR
jgi:hypothetical protein